MTKHNGSDQKITADASLPDAAPGETTIRVPVTTEHVPIYTLPAAAPQSNCHPVDDWVEQITTSWQKPRIEGIIETGKRLLAAKKALDRGDFISMIRSDKALPFNERTAQRLMKIAEHPVLSNATHVSHLPTSWGTLYELSKATPKLLEAKIQDGTITPRLERSQVARKIFGKIPKAAQHTLDRVKQLRGELDAAQAYIAELEAARDAETAPPLTPGPGPETEPVNPEPVEAEVGQPQPEAERPVALATDTVPIAPTETADDETEPDEEEDLEPTAEETLTNAIESVELLLDKLFDEEIIYRLAEVDLDKRDALLSRLRAGLNRRVDAIERAPVLDKADAIAALPESVKAYFRMHGRVSNCDVCWYINRFPALNKLEDSERRAIADKLIRDMLQCGELIKVSRKRDVYEIAGSPAHAYNAGYAPRRE